MTLEELKNILEATGFPVAYSHFVETENNPLPELPFICYLEIFASNFSADNKVYKNIKNIQIELYTDKKDEQAEIKVESVLNENELFFYSSETYIESEKIYQKIYEVRLF